VGGAAQIRILLTFFVVVSVSHV